MLPYVEIFGVSLPMYGIISIIGVFASGLVALGICKKRKVDKYDFIFTALVAGFGLLVGAHLLYAITRAEDIITIFGDYSYYRDIWDFLGNLWSIVSGMVFYGGLYGGLLAGFLFAKSRRYPLADMSDLFAVAIPLFHAFGRVGCFFAGCCYGMKWEHGIAGRVLTQGMRESAKRLPVQLVEAMCLVVIFFVMLWLCSKNRLKGRLIFVYLIIYAVVRFTLEFFRGDEIRGRLWIFSTSQWISLTTLVWVGLYLYITFVKKRKLNKLT